MEVNLLTISGRGRCVLDEKRPQREGLIVLFLLSDIETNILYIFHFISFKKCICFGLDLRKWSGVDSLLTQHMLKKLAEQLHFSL